MPGLGLFDLWGAGEVKIEVYVCRTCGSMVPMELKPKDPNEEQFDPMERHADWHRALMEL